MYGQAHRCLIGVFTDHEGFDPDDPLQQLSRRIVGGGWRSAHFKAIAEVAARL